MFNHLVQNVLKDCELTSFHPIDSTDKPSSIPLVDGLNIGKYSFIMTITVPTIPGENTIVRSSREIIDENAFVIKELVTFVSNFKKSKETPTIIIYDKTSEYKINDELSNLPTTVAGYFVTTKLTQIQEASLLRVLNVYRHFSIALIERIAINNFEVINTVGHNILKADSIPSWPWRYTDIEFIFKEKMVKPINDKMVKQKNIHKKPLNLKAIYFFNWMIPVCRSFTTTLRDFYNKIKENNNCENFEIFGCMFDQEKYSDENLLKTMPWCTLKCSKETLDRIKFTLGVFHVPSLVLLDENNDIITRNGRWLVCSDPKGESFDWTQWSWDMTSPLSWASIRPWNFYLFWEVPSLIVFGDSEDETYIDEWLGALGQMQLSNVQQLCCNNRTQKTLQLTRKNFTKNQFINGSAMLLFKCIDDDEFLTHYGLADLGVPLAVIFDSFTGVTICEDETMSADVLTKFLNDYLKGKIVPTIAAVPKSDTTVQPLPTPTGSVKIIALDDNRDLPAE